MTLITKKQLYGLILCLTFSLSPKAAKADCMPFVGEDLVYSIGWEFINAGTAHMSIKKHHDGWRLHTQANSNAFLDAMVKKVRDQIITEGRCVDGKMQSLRFELIQHEGDYQDHKLSLFDWQKKQVSYQAHERTTYYPIRPHSLSALDAFLAVRSMPLVVGQKIAIPVFDAGEQYDVVVTVLGRTWMTLPGGRYIPCLIIEPKLRTAGIFSSKGSIKIWISDDQRRIPLKLTAKIRFGRIIARLMEYKQDS